MAKSEQLSVFLCHASEDKISVRNLYQQLIKDGYDVWFDEVKLIPGQDWKHEIQSGLRNADVIIFCLSSLSIRKEGYVQVEIKEALEIAKEKPDETIFIVPLRLDECEVPNSIKRWQWVDLFQNQGYERLKSSLNLRSNQIALRSGSVNSPQVAINKSNFLLSKKIITKDNVTNIGVQKSINIEPTKPKRKKSLSDKISDTIYGEHYYTDDYGFGLDETTYSMDFSPDGQLLIAGISDGTIRLWRVSDASLLDTVGVEETVNKVVFSPTANQIATLSGTNAIHFWNVTNRILLQSSIKHTAGIRDIAISPDGQILAFASLDSTIRLWDINNNTYLQEYNEHTGPVNSIAFSPDGDVLISGSYDYSIRFWGVKSGKLLKTLRNKLPPIRVAISPDGKTFIASSESSIGVRRFSDGALLHEIDSLHMTDIDFSPNSELIAISSGRYERVLTGAPHFYWAKVYSDCFVRLCSTEDGKALNTLDRNGAKVECVAFSPNGTVLAVALSGKVICFWSLHDK